MSDALLAASIMVRAGHSALNGALNADGLTAARFASLYDIARSEAAADVTGSNAEPSLRFISTNPWSADVYSLTLVLTASGIDLRLQHPLQARATVRGDNRALLALLRKPDLLVDTGHVQVEDDEAFAVAVLRALNGLRPDLLLPLSELVGSGLPSALHTVRAAAGGLIRGAFDMLRARATPSAQRPSAQRPSAQRPSAQRPPSAEATAPLPDARSDDPNGAP